MTSESRHTHTHTHTAILSIDIGTTAIKAIIIPIHTNQHEARSENREHITHHSYSHSHPHSHYDILSSSTRSHHAYVDYSNDPQKHHRYKEQDVFRLLYTINQCILSLPYEHRRCVEHITLTGQMHGMVLWFNHENALNGIVQRMTNTATLHNDIDVEKETVTDDGMSVKDCLRMMGVTHLITWEDQRCDDEFLHKLRTGTGDMNIHSGYGCATLAWLIEHNQLDTQHADAYMHIRGSTIMDFLYNVLASPTPTNTTHLIHRTNAHSWGFYDIQQHGWNTDALEAAQIPTHILPAVLASDSICTSGVYIRHDMRKHWQLSQQRDVKVYVAVGDAASYVHALVDDHNTADKDAQDGNSAIISIGTSLQFTVELPNSTDTTVPYPPHTLRPSLTDQYLLFVCASMNGGNVYKALAHSIAKCRGMTVDDAYEMMNTEGMKYLNTSMRINAAVYTERYPFQRTHKYDVTLSNDTVDSSISGLLQSNKYSVGEIAASVSRDIIQNIYDMVHAYTDTSTASSQSWCSSSVLDSRRALKCVGAAVMKNPMFIYYINEILRTQTQLVDDKIISEYGTCIGVAALVALAST